MNKLGQFAAACAVVVCAFGASAAGKSSLDYVQDGLVAMWDGHENAGFGSHDAEATKWVDLVGGVEIDLPSWVAVEDHSLYSTGGTSHVASKITSIDGLSSSDEAWTIEIVQQSCGWTATDNYMNLQSVFGTPRGSLGYRQNNEKGFYFFGPSSATQCSLQNWVHATAKVADLHTMSAVVGKDKSTCAIWMDGAKDTVNYNGGWTDNNPTAFSFFGNPRMSICVYAIRVYNRVLSSDEVAANRAVDVTRFVNGEYFTGAGCLVVAGSPVDCGEVSPAYGITNGIAVGTSFTCSAPKSCMDAAGLCAYECVGYEVTTNGFVYVKGADSSFTYIQPDCANGAKLVWQWQQSGIGISLAAGEGGTVSGATGIKQPGDVVAITAEPAAGKRFFRWVGDVDGVADVLSAETTVTMGETPVALTALFGDEIVVAPEGGTTNNLNDAVAIAKDYDTILVKDGTYINKTAAFLAVTKPIAIVSENGKEHAFFRSEKNPSGGKININPAYKGMQVNHEFAVVRGLTFFNFGCDAAQNPQGLGVYLNAGLVEDCVISNTLPNHGASALHVTGGTARRMLITKNNSNNTSKGAGAYLTGGSLLDSVICGNSDGVDGGGVYVNGANAVVRNCQIFSNSTSGSGGGVGLALGLVENCVITNNSGNAGGVYQTGGTLRDCLVKGNKSGYSQKYGGVRSTGGTIENCDVIGNIAYYPVGKQFYKTAGTVKGTTVAEGAQAIPCSSLVEIEDGVTVEDCVFQAPGIEGATELNASDYFGSGDCRIFADKVVGAAPLTVNFEAKCNGATSWGWYFAELGSSTAEKPNFTFVEPGRYTVTLICGAKSGTLDILALPTKTYVGKNGTATFPYDTAAKATPDFQAAHDAVYADDETQGTVEVLADTYKYTGTGDGKSLTPWLLVNKNVMVQGATGNRDDVVFDAQRKVVTTFLFHPKAALKDLTISNGSYSPFSSTMCGGSLYMLGGLVTNCVVSKGYSLMAGNATVFSGQVWDSTFCDGESSTAGGDRYDGGVGVWGKALVANCLVTGGNGGRGGGVSLHHADAVVSNCVIRGNKRAPYGGSGAAVDAGLLTHCVITNNTGAYGGGVYIYGTNAKVRNCLIAKNTTSGAGGGVQIDKGLIENCTVAYNTSASSTRSDELRRVGGTVRNCIFCGKDTPAMKDVSGTGGTITYSCFRADVGVTGTGVLCQDPKLKSPTADDFTPMFDSPAIDKGVEIADVTSDLRGLLRPINGSWDMGCYEMDFTGQLYASFDADKTEGGGLTEVTLSANVTGGRAPYSYAWTIGGETVTTDEEVYTVTLGYGSHTITLVVTDKDGNSADPVVREDLVKIKAPVVYVSTTGSSVWPYDTWERATADWSEAVGAVYATAAVPGKIWVADGTYTVHDSKPCTAPLTDPIELCGTNPACKAILDGQGKYHRVVNVAHAQARVANICFDNCNSGYGTSSDSEPGAGAIALTAGTVSNCVFSGGSGNGAGLVYQKDGLLTDCVIRNHNAGTHTGGDREGGGLHLAGGTAERLVVSGCTDGSAGAVYVVGTSAVLRDSVICNNYTEAGGAIGLVKGVVENCIITNNTSGSGSEGFGVTAGTGGAGAYQIGGTLRNCLIADNRSSGSGDLRGALYVTGASTKAYNNTVWVNTMKNGVTNDVTVASGTLANTLACTVTNVAGTVSHCFVAATDGDPKFKSPKKAAFHLKSSSPCINGGDNSLWDGVADPVDLDGTPRIRNGIVDIGCFEGDQSGLRLIVR